MTLGLIINLIYGPSEQLKIIHQYTNCNLQASYSAEDKKKYQNLQVKAIIATDMALHNNMIEEIKTKNKNYDPDSIQDKEFLIGMMTHCADLNNPDSFMY